ncbi:MAG TPA: YqeG family HAD IIIA-type phosphatase [Magnetospirillaceae bacterium]|nr:YqeG family HAD IIIA-type phosphatase [Magnetospirillaceae bacterium]
MKLRNPRQFMRPFRWVRSVVEISLDALWAAGFRAMVIDLDNTLVGYKLLEPAPEVAEWVRAAQQRGFAIAIVSNNVRAWVASVATMLGIVTFVHTALKPLPFGVMRALKQLRVRRSQTMVVGDQLFADVLAAKLMGTSAILTDPLVRHEHRAMWPVRLAERFMLLGTQPPERRA